MPPFTPIRTSGLPSLLVSPMASPRAENSRLNTAPAWGLMFRKVRSFCWNRSSGSRYRTWDDRSETLSSGWPFARITWQANGVKRSKLKTAGGSYLSAHDPRDILGLGEASHVEWVEVRWPAPSTRVEKFSGLKPNRYSTIVEGEGERAG